MVKNIAKIAHGSDVYYLKDSEARQSLIDKTEKGAANGVATLDSSGKVPSSQLPSYVDDIIEGYYHEDNFYATFTPGEDEDPDIYSDLIAPETGKIYVNKDTNYTYRWSGSAYVMVGSPTNLELTSATIIAALGYTPSATDTTYTAGTGLALTGTEFALATSGVTAGSYGPSADVDGTNGTTISVPYITVDEYGRVTSISNKTYTSRNTDTNTTYSAGTGLSLSGTTFSLALTKAMVTTALGYTPPTSDTNTTYSASTGLSLSGTAFSVKYGTTAGTACQGNDSRLSNSRPASDVYSWAKASSKPSYAWSEITGKPTIPSVTTGTCSSTTVGSTKYFYVSLTAA